MKWELENSDSTKRASTTPASTTLHRSYPITATVMNKALTLVYTDPHTISSRLRNFAYAFSITGVSKVCEGTAAGAPNAALRSYGEVMRKTEDLDRSHSCWRLVGRGSGISMGLLLLAMPSGVEAELPRDDINGRRWKISRCGRRMTIKYSRVEDLGPFFIRASNVDFAESLASVLSSAAIFSF